MINGQMLFSNAKNPLGSSSVRRLFGFVVLALVMLLGGATDLLAAAADNAAGVAQEAVETGPVGISAPDLTATDYPTVRGVNSRVTVWLIAQLHLWFGKAFATGGGPWQFQQDGELILWGMKAMV